MLITNQQQKLKDQSSKNDDDNANQGDNNKGVKSGAQDKDNRGGDQQIPGAAGGDGDDQVDFLIDPNTCKKMTKRRMQQLQLPASQIEELTKRGFLLQATTASAAKLKSSILHQSNQKF